MGLQIGRGTRPFERLLQGFRVGRVDADRPLPGRDSDPKRVSYALVLHLVTITCPDALEARSAKTLQRPRRNRGGRRMSSDELKLAQGLLQDLNNEIDRLDEQMDQMLTEMEGIPEERR